VANNPVAAAIIPTVSIRYIMSELPETINGDITDPMATPTMGDMEQIIYKLNKRSVSFSRILATALCWGGNQFAASFVELFNKNG
jgi:hypothetical protein